MSENSLDGLIAKVKSEAIDKAEEEAKEIIRDAEERASQLIKNAESEKEELLARANEEANQTIEKGKVALGQASRDLEISVKNDFIKLFNAVFKNNIEASFTPELYTEIVKLVVTKIGENTRIELPESISDKVVESIRKQVKDSKIALEVIKNDKLLSGLSISKVDEGWSYDITAEAISDLLSQHLSQKWIDILKHK
jgi:F0F1-type ATP synthase membrane subunit b/b'